MSRESPGFSHGECQIVLDLEWNQPSSPKAMVRSPVFLRGEIIQIGAVKLNEDLEIIDTFKIMVKPKYYRTMHKTVSGLTKDAAQAPCFSYGVKL